EHRRSDGVFEYPFGPKPSGRLVYLAGGKMVVLITDPARARARLNQFFEAADSELADASRGCVAYSGRWEIHGNEVVHDVEQSLFPNWTGIQLARAFRLDGDLLSLSTTAFTIHGKEYTAVLVWEKEV
ncbi:MAG: lipocalin-like domain-containing protein, partial [Elusimicrobia bacterium]|nr:lipocalin-like domain-containing protein [Elusimicrobiota bacterium]